MILQEKPKPVQLPGSRQKEENQRRDFQTRARVGQRPEDTLQAKQGLAWASPPARGAAAARAPDTRAATALPPTATGEGEAPAGRGADGADPASRGWRPRATLPAQLPQGGDHGRQLQPVVAHADAERLSKPPPPPPRGSSTATSGESGAPTGARAVQNSSRKPPSAATRRRLFPFLLGPGGNPGGGGGGAGSGRARPIFLCPRPRPRPPGVHDLPRVVLLSRCSKPGSSAKQNPRIWVGEGPDDPTVKVIDFTMSELRI